MNFYRNGELPDSHPTIFIYGDGGTGKTSLFKQFPGEKKLLISFDLSTDVLKGVKGMDVATIEDSDVPFIQQVVDKWISDQTFKHYDTVALDNVSALQNYVLENIDGRSKDGRQNYQKLQLWFRELGAKLRRSGVNVYATAHQVDKGPDFIKGRYEADLTAKTFNAFTSMFDLVGRIYLKDGQRIIDLDPENGNHAKNRLDDRKLIKADELFKTNSDENEEENE